MLKFIKHRRDGLARSSLALGIIAIALLMQHVPKTEVENTQVSPATLMTQHAKYSKSTVDRTKPR
jgi:hypothetical protein